MLSCRAANIVLQVFCYIAIVTQCCYNSNIPCSILSAGTDSSADCLSLIAVSSQYCLHLLQGEQVNVRFGGADVNCASQHLSSKATIWQDRNIVRFAEQPRFRHSGPLLGKLVISENVCRILRRKMRPITTQTCVRSTRQDMMSVLAVLHGRLACKILQR